MTIQEIESTLPNGFHDAELHRYEVDYVAGTARSNLELWVGDLKSKSEEKREAYRFGSLTLLSLDYFVTEAPDPTYAQATPWVVDLCEPLPDFPQSRKESNFRARFYSSSTNSFIHFAASEAAFTYNEKSNHVIDPTRCACGS